MPAIPVRDGSSPAKSPCLAHGCALCCYETEMPLTESDIAKLERRGHKRDDFVAMDGSYPVLKNVPATLPREGHHCYFLRDDRCSVYEDRPEGCRWYPVVVTPERRLVKDEDCPHKGEFPVPAGAQRRLVALINELDREAKKRVRS